MAEPIIGIKVSGEKLGSSPGAEASRRPCEAAGRSTRGADKPSTKEWPSPANEAIADQAPDNQATVGVVLRRRREAFGQTLEDIASDLMIRRAYLRAIEDGDFSRLPGLAYATGFVRAYADHCGLDPDDIVQRFKAEARDHGAGGAYVFPQPATERRIPFGPAIAIAVVVAAIGYGGWILLSPQPASVPGEPASTGQSAAVSEKIDPKSVSEGAGGAPSSAHAPTTPPPAVRESPTIIEQAPRQAAISLAPRPKGPPPIMPPTAKPAPLAAPPSTPVFPAEPPVGSAPNVPQGAPAETATEGRPAGEGQPSAETEPIVEREVAAEPPPAEETPPAEPAVVYGSSEEESRVTVAATRHTVIKIYSITGDVLFEQKLAPGEAYRVPDRPGLLMTTSNAGGLRILVDGQPAPRIGPPGASRQNVFLNPTLLQEGRAAPR